MRAAGEALGLKAMCVDAGLTLRVVGKLDSTAAKAMAQRRGLGGKCKHMAIQYLWLQGCVNNREVTLSKCSTLENLADLPTKYLSRPRID